MTHHPTPDQAILPAEALASFVQSWFDRRETYLRLFRENGRPLYVLEPDVLTRQADRFKKAFQPVLPETGFYFAVKSNNHPGVARTLLESGFGLDVSSGLELRMALDLGADNIVFSGPGKTADELKLAVDNAGRVTVLIDSFGELQRLEPIAAAANTTVRAGVRLTTNPSGLWRKFGILPDQLPEFQQAALRCPHIDLRGIQFHTSWNLTPRAHADFIRTLGALLAAMPEAFTRQLAFIDIGGGYWPEQGEWLHQLPEGETGTPEHNPSRKCRPHYRLAAEPITVFAREIGRAVTESIWPVTACRICLEPGRWICHEAMQLLMSVVDKKGDDLVITDAGTNTIGWERFETDYFPVLNLTRPDLTERPCHVLGALCTPHDVWGYSYFGQDIQVGDILMIPAQGAYTYSLRQNFIKPVPDVVVLNR
ncbi:MAG: alanine racemase [Thermodesulfobacteriota bacterium]